MQDQLHCKEYTYAATRLLLDPAYAAYAAITLCAYAAAAVASRCSAPVVHQCLGCSQGLLQGQQGYVSNGRWQIVQGENVITTRLTALGLGCWGISNMGQLLAAWLHSKP
jgi:hypothetical protein